MRRTSAVTKILLLVAFLAAVAARVGYFHVLHPEAKDVPTTRPAGTLSAEEAVRRDMWKKEHFNGTVARNLVTTGRFAGWAPLSGREAWRGTADDPAPGTAFVAPGYPVLLAGIYKLTGPANVESNFTVLFFVQAVIGALGCIFAFYLARRVFGSTLVGWLAWLATAGSYFLITSAVKVNPQVLAGTLVTWSVLMIVAAADTASLWRYLLAGVVAGLTVLVVPGFLVVLPLAYLWMLTYGKGSGGKRFALSLVCVLLFVVVVAPWTIRNYTVFNKVVPVTDSFGYHFWVGNNARANGGDRVLGGSVEATALRPQARQKYEAVGHEVERYRTMARDAYTWIREDAFRSIQLRLHTYTFFWFGRNAWLKHPLDYQHPMVLPVTVLMLMLVLVGVGVRKTERQRARAWMLYIVLLLYPIPYALSHVTSLPTHRLPLDPLLLILAAYAVATFVTGGRVGKEKAEKPEPKATSEPDLSLQPLG